MSVKDCNIGHTNWVSNVKSMLNNYGYSYVFDNPSSVNVKLFINDFKCRLIDTFKQECLGNINRSSMLDMYRIFKTTFEYENYLDLLPKKLRLYFVKLRISVHLLRIQTGRFALFVFSIYL